MLRRTAMLLLVSCAITVSYFGFGNWLPSLLQARGVDVTRSLAYTSLIALSYPIAPYGFSWFADRFERKWQIVVGCGITVLAGLLFAIQTAPAGWIAFGLIITIANNLAYYAIHTYRRELFPTVLRARGIGMVYSIDRLVAMLVVGISGPRTRGLATEAISNS